MAFQITLYQVFTSSVMWPASESSSLVDVACFGGWIGFLSLPLRATGSDPKQNEIKKKGKKMEAELSRGEPGLMLSALI